MMSLFPMPVKIEKRIDALRRKFIWQGNKENRSYDLVKWNTLTCSKKEGGLGIRNLIKHSKSIDEMVMEIFLRKIKIYGEGL